MTVFVKSYWNPCFSLAYLWGGGGRGGRVPPLTGSRGKKEKGERKEKKGKERKRKKEKGRKKGKKEKKGKKKGRRREKKKKEKKRKGIKMGKLKKKYHGRTHQGGGGAVDPRYFENVQFFSWKCSVGLYQILQFYFWKCKSTLMTSSVARTPFTPFAFEILRKLLTHLSPSPTRKIFRIRPWKIKTNENRKI